MARGAQHFDRMRTALTAGRLDEALALAESAVCEAPGQSMIVRLVAEALERAGRGREGAALLTRAIERSPDDPMLLIGLGGRLIQLGRSDEAIGLFEAAICADPASAEGHFALAKTLANASDFAGARVNFEQALEIAPAYADARAGLAALLARSGDAQEARRQAERALADAPGHADATIALASVEVRERAYAEAEARLRAVLRSPGLDAFARAMATHLLADALDGQDRAAAAYLSYAAANELFRQQASPHYPEAARAYIDNLDRLAGVFAAADPADWRGAPSTPSEKAAATHVFLVGFPRSGTTLLENVLAAHPVVVALEEGPTLNAAEAAFLEMPDGAERLAAIDAETAERFRVDYWRCVRDEGVRVEGKTFIDKLPLNTPRLPAVAKLFPQAKILFARRDPRDVTLSCFRRSFLPNIATYSMKTLKGGRGSLRRGHAPGGNLSHDAAAGCPRGALRDLGRGLRGGGAFALRLSRSGVGRSGARLRGTDGRARLINTPSAAQVRRGIYRGGEGQWRRYRDQMAPVLPILAPWIEPFGYADELGKGDRG